MLVLQVVLFTNLAMVHAKRGDSDEVLKAADEALKLDPNCCKALYRKGTVLLARNDLEQAAECQRLALKHGPSDPGSSFSKGVQKELAKIKKRQAAENKKDAKKFGGACPATAGRLPI